MHKIERWRDRLIAEEGALTEFLRDMPGVDATEARQLIRNARREAAENKPPKSSRALFRLIRDALEAPGLNCKIEQALVCVESVESTAEPASQSWRNGPCAPVSRRA